MGKLIILSGVAGAGKTTWAKNYVESHVNTISLNTDAIRFELYGQYVLPSDEEKTALRTLFNRAVYAATKNINVIIDSACVKNKSIIKWINKLGSYFSEHELVVIDTPLDVCLKQNRERERHVPEHIIREMYSYRQNISNDPKLNSLFDKITIINNQGDR